MPKIPINMMYERMNDQPCAPSCTGCGYLFPYEEEQNLAGKKNIPYTSAVFSIIGYSATTGTRISSRASRVRPLAINTTWR